MNPEEGTNPQAAEPARSAGALLKAAREKQGLHIAALAAAIKVSPRKLEALEADRFEELPDATFVRALAQTVCRTLKIDARPVLDLLPAAGPHALVPPDEGLNQPFREPAMRSLRSADDGALARLARRPMLWGAGVLLLASVALYLLPLPTLRTPAPAVVATPAASVPASAAAAGAEPASAPEAIASAASPGPAAAASEPQAAEAASAPVAETVFSAPPPDATDAAPAAQALLQLRVREASWIEVRDARGSVLLSRTVLPGEQVGLNGATPLSLVVGNAGATELVFRGRGVDLAARSRDNVARLQLP